MQRIEQAHAHDRTDQDKSVGREGAWRMAIAPHDDYCYVGSMYPLVLNGVRARTVVMEIFVFEPQTSADGDGSLQAK